MRKNKWFTLVAVSLALAACNPRDRAMPDLENAQATTRAGMTLSPWKDGSPDRSSDGEEPGDNDGDRLTFFRWYFRWAIAEDAHRLNYAMPSVPVPATMGEAVDQQHEYESKQRAAAAARKLKADAEAATSGVPLLMSRERTNSDQQEIDDDAAYYQEQAKAEAAQQAAQDAKDAADRQQAARDQAARQKADEECGKRRDAAAKDWMQNGPGSSGESLADLYKRFGCNVP